MFDVGIVGGGPAGASCASLCAAAGLRTVVFERAIFPREKVCGDCLNPACWPILQRLQLAERTRSLPHGILDRVDFIGTGGRTITVALPTGEEGEITIKRSLLDHLIMQRAAELGATIHEGATVIALIAPDKNKRYWTITTATGIFETQILVAADGRNSTVARLCNLLSRNRRERIGLQTHLPLPTGFGNRVVLQFLPEGYSGQAPVGNGELNLCLVSVPQKMAMLRHWAESQFGVPRDHSWRTITPLARTPIAVAHPALFFVGDAARVVEPFTGEGIYYALASGGLAADAIISFRNGRSQTSVAADYAAAHHQLYQGRLWINRLARLAVLSPRLTSAAMELLRFQPTPLRFLTKKIVQI